MTTEEKIHIAASFDTEKIKMIRELMEESFNAGRERIGGFWNEQIKNWQYPTFKDYSTNKPNKQ